MSGFFYFPGHFYCLQHLPQEDQIEADSDGSPENQVKNKQTNKTVCLCNGIWEEAGLPRSVVDFAGSKWMLSSTEEHIYPAHCLTMSTRWGP